MIEPFFSLTKAEQSASLKECALSMLEQFDIRVTAIDLLNYEYNATFKIVTTDEKNYALRINVNSPRSRSNIEAEVEWVRFLRSSGIPTAEPKKSSTGSHVVSTKHEASGRELNGVLYSWLVGSEVGDQPSEEQLTILGATMAKMHEVSGDFELTKGSELPKFDDPFWGTDDHLLSARSKLNGEDRALISAAFERITERTNYLYSTHKPLLIHADLHGWNLMWSDGKLAVFDFDDCGIGLPIQDLAVAIYYLDTPEQDRALLDGYRTVRPLPGEHDSDIKMMLVHRRLMLLNYLYETSNAEHSALLPSYLPETLRRVKAFLAT